MGIAYRVLSSLVMQTAKDVILIMAIGIAWNADQAIRSSPTTFSIAGIGYLTVRLLGRTRNQDALLLEMLLTRMGTMYA